MSNDASSLLRSYFDDELSQSELESLQAWLAKDPKHQVEFVQLGLLHNQLHGLVQAHLALLEDHQPARGWKQRLPVTGTTRKLLAVATLAAAMMLMLFTWRGDGTAQAGQAELRKMIALSAQPVLRSYLIEVESHVVGGAKQKRRTAEDLRPPKPPLDGGQLYVRGAHEFVLKRKTAEGRPFITGSDGHSSWMVPPSGPVRRSVDLQEFNRDVPGHEFSMSLCNLTEALEQLSHSYELNALPTEYSDSENLESTRLLVATKKRGSPGPRRVEITYIPHSGQMEQLRFIDMPYGPDRLTVRMSLLDVSSVADGFFQHQAHHEPDRPIETE